MKKIIYIFSLMVFTLNSCNDKVIDKKQRVTEPTRPTFVSKLPSFNANALYVVGREYETLKNGTSKKSPIFKLKGKVVCADTLTLSEYIEMRLIELYPDKAYSGMAKDMEEEGKIAMQFYIDYLEKLKIWEASQGIYQVDPKTEEITSIIRLIEVMNPSIQELEFIQRLESLATGATYATIADFENIFRINGDSSNRKSQQLIVVDLLVNVNVLPVIGVPAYLVALMCETRTYDKIEEYYGTRNPPSGAQRKMLSNILA